MPVQKLKRSQIMTMGAKELAILVVPNGWMENSKTRMAQEAPMMVEEEMLGDATSIPCIAPKTD